ncbi:MAG: ECF-type sigma factor [Akkermansiaceae bacterium]
MSIEETADAMNISRRTVVRNWKFTRAWLARRLNQQNR